MPGGLSIVSASFVIFAHSLPMDSRVFIIAEHLLLRLTSQFLSCPSTLDCIPHVRSTIPLATRMITQAETLSQTQISGQNLPETCAS